MKLCIRWSYQLDNIISYHIRCTDCYVTSKHQCNVSDYCKCHHILL